MSDPRETAFAAVAAKLEDIQIINGYAVDVDKVYRVDVVPDEMPLSVRRALLVLESLAPETWDFLDSGAQGGFLCRCNMTVAGVMRGGMTDSRDSQRVSDTNALLMACVRALMADPTFSGAMENSLIKNPVVFIDTDRAEGLFNLTLSCIYKFDYGDL